MITESDATDPDFSFVSCKRKEKRTNIINSGNVSNMADRLNLSVRQRTAFAASVVSACNVDIDEVSLSKSTSWKAGKETREKTAKSIKKDFIIPEFVAVHWDTKIVHHSFHKKSERLAILISGIPGSKESKLLSVPKIPDATGQTQSKATFNVLQEWQIHSNVVALVFDTTASNSEWINGACKHLELLLNQRFLWCACRHHIFERILCTVFQELFGASNSPDNELARNFRDNL